MEITPEQIRFWHITPRNYLGDANSGPYEQFLEGVRRRLIRLVESERPLGMKVWTSKELWDEHMKDPEFREEWSLDGVLLDPLLYLTDSNQNS